MKKSRKLAAVAGLLLGGGLAAFMEAVIANEREVSEECYNGLIKEGRVHVQFIDDDGRLIDEGGINKQGGV